MEKKFMAGERILIELRNGNILEATFAGSIKNSIDIHEIVEYPSGAPIGGTLTYYNNEIASIKLLTEVIKGKETPTSSDDIDNLNFEDRLTITSEDEENRTRIKLKQKEFDRLKDAVKRHNYYATMDTRYYEAVDYLSSCETVGLALFNSCIGITAQICLIVLASWDEVHVFDLLQFGHKTFPTELKKILESGDILKVVHDARQAVFYLQNLKNVKLENVYCTKIADLMISKRENGACPDKARNISECLNKYLNFPASILEKAIKVPPQTWSVRPLRTSHLSSASLLVVYLITLRNTTQKILMKDFYDTIKTDVDTVLKSTAVQSQMALTTLNVSEKTKTLIQK